MVIIYTDGACSCNNKNKTSPGGWCYLALLPCGTQVLKSGHVDNTTNNRMELLSVIEALKQMHGEILVVADSKYVINGATEWIYNWKSNNWKTAANKDVLNKDLWEELYKLMHQKYNNVQFKWVKGHNGDKYNTIVDSEAVSASKRRE